jgi:hypothetical protein
MEENMNSTNVKTVYDLFKGDVPKGEAENLKIKLENVPDEKLTEIKSVPIHKSTTMTLLSAVLGWTGVDRFIIRDKVFGLIKCICSAVALILSLVIFVAVVPNYSVYATEYTNLSDAFSSVNTQLKTQIDNLSNSNESTMMANTVAYQNYLVEFKDTLDEIINKNVTSNKVKNDIDSIYKNLNAAIESSKTANTQLINNGAYSDTLATAVKLKASNKTANNGDLGVLKYLEDFSDSLSNGKSHCIFVRDYCNLFFMTVVIILAVIVVAYWVFDIFYVREENKKLNYSKIISVIEN